MTPGSTRTGGVLESTILPALRMNGYAITIQPEIGVRPDGRRHRVDVLAESQAGVLIPISLKWQQVSGTAEEKVPFEVIKLIHAVKGSGGRYPYAYLVIGGEGWSALRPFYLEHGLRDYIRDYDLVKLVSLERFITLANRKIL